MRATQNALSCTRERLRRSHKRACASRFNYLSGLGAKLLASSPGMKGAANVLHEDKDRSAARPSPTGA
eukprot:259308-Pleurochrysis_carterae.AAC.1